MIPGENDDGALLLVPAIPQLSDTAGLPNITLLAVHKPGSMLTVRLAGHVMEGSWASWIVTLNVHVLVNPPPSVAVAITSVVPTGNADPLDGIKETIGVPQLSDARALSDTTAEH